MFSEIIFKLKHIFKGFDNYNQLEQINKVMGTEDLKQLLVKYDLQLDVKYNEYLGRYKKKRWDSFITSENKHFCTPDAMDLLTKMLLYDHMARITPKDAM
jgi:casein kinase II subunit alpha